MRHDTEIINKRKLLLGSARIPEPEPSQEFFDTPPPPPHTVNNKPSAAAEVRVDKIAISVGLLLVMMYHLPRQPTHIL